MKVYQGNGCRRCSYLRISIQNYRWSGAKARRIDQTIRGVRQR